MSDANETDRAIDRRLFVALAATALIAGCAPGESKSGMAAGDSANGSSAAAAVPVSATAAPAGRDVGGLLDAIGKRRSWRSFTSQPVAEDDIALMAWAAQGITDQGQQLRAVPSAMAAYPLRLYVATAGSLRLWDSAGNGFKVIRKADVRPRLVEASGQQSVEQAPAVFIVTGQYGLLRKSMGEKAEMCVHLEAGHATQNLVLTATALGLGAVTAGAFEDSMVVEAIGAGKDETAFYLVPVGHRA